MYLGKPALLIPVHIEQEVNGEDAAGIGAGVVAKEFDLSQLVEFIPNYAADTEKFRAWVAQGEELFVRHLTTLV
jgi:UDP:flavonoid glycosyltransferase YjiC (YdhE family)